MGCGKKGCAPQQTKGFTLNTKYLQKTNKGSIIFSTPFIIIYEVGIQRVVKEGKHEDTPDWNLPKEDFFGLSCKSSGSEEWAPYRGPCLFSSGKLIQTADTILGNSETFWASRELLSTWKATEKPQHEQEICLLHWEEINFPLFHRAPCYIQRSIKHCANAQNVKNWQPHPPPQKKRKPTRLLIIIININKPIRLM